MDVRTVAAALAVIVGATMFFALVPALASLKRQLTTELKSGERGSSRGARRLYSVLVGAELALACGAARRLGAARAHRAADDRDTHRRERRRRGHDPHPGAAGTGTAGHGHRPLERAGHPARRHPRRRAAGARRAGGRGDQLPALRGRLARAVPDRGRPAAAAPRRCAAGSVAQRERRLLRGDGGADRPGPRLRRVRRPRRHRRGGRQRDVRAPLPGRPRAGGDHVDEPGQRHRPARREPEVGARPARRAGRDCRRRRRHPQRRARPGRRARDLLHDAPVPVLGGGHRRARRGCRHRRGRRPQRPAQGRTGSADGRAPHAGAAGWPNAPPTPACCAAC